MTATNYNPLAARAGILSWTLIGGFVLALVIPTDAPLNALLGLYMIGAIPFTTITGAMALGQIGASPDDQEGRGNALFAVITGCALGALMFLGLVSELEQGGLL